MEEIKNTIYFALNAYSELYNCDYLPNVLGTVVRLQTFIKEIDGFKNKVDYPALVKKAIKEYNHDNEDMVETDVIEFMNNPSESKLQELRRTVCVRLTNNYAPYWEAQIANLKRKDAIIKRRNYLAENCEMMANVCRDNGFTDLAALFLQYRDEQIKILELKQN